MEGGREGIKYRVNKVFVVACRGREGGMEGGREGIKYRVNKVARSFALLVSTFFVFLLLVWFAASSGVVTFGLPDNLLFSLSTSLSALMPL